LRWTLDSWLVQKRRVLENDGHREMVAPIKTPTDGSRYRKGF
jgi:hypothetical protein